MPILVFIEDVAASGGYWLSCIGDEIFADIASIVGSIGVISASFGFTEAIERIPDPQPRSIILLGEMILNKCKSENKQPAVRS